MYLQLKAAHIKQDEENRKFIAEYGEEAFAARQKLL